MAFLGRGYRPFIDDPNGPGLEDPGGFAPEPAAAPAVPTASGGQTVEENTGGHGGGGGNGYDFGNLGALPTFDFGQVPNFTPPEFQAPDAQSLLNSPAYQFRLGQGTDALQHSAAAKGLLRSGGTLTDLLEYGQNFASGEYNNEFNRALQTYGTKYQSAKDQFAPKYGSWQLNAQAQLQAALAQYQRQWEMYQFGHQYHSPQQPIIPPFEANPYA